MKENGNVLEIRGLSVSYGNIKAVREISFVVGEGEIVTLIGANGSGKTSILKAISGIVPFKGTIIYDGRNLSGTPAHKIVSLGIAHVPEGRGIFGNLTVLENLRLATWQNKEKSDIARRFEYVFDLFPRLKERMRQPGGTLSGGEQQMLAVARALMSRTRLLLLDEPSMGLSPKLSQEIFQMIHAINKEGVTILLVEQNANMAFHLASRGHVLETGSIIFSGTGVELKDNPIVRTAYLGTGVHSS
jgi:branched-chain amino acid transport system ATP-binding protein